jgi:hypothetical protein
MVASASLYPDEEGFVDTNGMMLYFVDSAGANRFYSYRVGRVDPTITFSSLGAARRSPSLDFRFSTMSAVPDGQRSWKIPPDIRLKIMVGDVEGVRLALNLGKISLRGHCYGGALAQAFNREISTHGDAPDSGRAPGRAPRR